MLNNIFNIIIQNKNLLMLLTAIIYSVSIYATLSEHLLIFITFFTCGFLIFTIKNSFPLKYIVVWLLIFFFGVINTTLRLRDVDELLNLAPLNSEITGTITSIPQGIREGKPKFFFNVDSIKFGTITKTLNDEKVLVTMNMPTRPEELKLYKSGTLSGRLSTPFKAGNPSQFDYGNYLRNHNTYAVFYANTFSPIEKEVGFW